MRRVISVLIPLALVVGLAIPVCAEDMANDTTLVSNPGKSMAPSTKQAKKDEKKVAQSGASKPQVKPEITQLTDQYKTFRAKRAQVARAFEMMHNSSIYGETGQPAAPSPVSQEELRLPAIVSQLRAVKTLLENQDCAGTGDVKFWLRSENILNRQGQSAVAVLNGMVQNDGTNMNPLLRSALTMAANNLNSAMRQYDSATGDSNFWCRACTFTRDSLHNAAANLGQILGSLACPQASDCTAQLTGTSWVLETFLCANSDAGTGDATYWMRTQNLMCSQAVYAINAINNLIQLPNMQPMARTMLTNIANNLRAAVALYPGGSTGNSNYWMNACTQIVRSLHQAGSDFRTFRQSF
ncbi:MAG: hypothetical protein WA705_25800 [Candidatus Ozemobacteraceae bacterium]